MYDKQTKKRDWLLALAALALALVTLACGEAVAPTPEPTATPKPTDTLLPTNTPLPTSTPTNTPRPTSTPLPTDTPAPTNTPPPTNVPTSTPQPAPAATAAPAPPPTQPQPSGYGTVHLESRTTDAATCRISVWGHGQDFLLDAGPGHPGSHQVPAGEYGWQVFFGPSGATGANPMNLRPGSTCSFICYDTYIEWGCAP